jgi:type I restriction enzyme M protein
VTTEDQVRDMASEILGLAGVPTRVAQSGVGQITTMNQLGFSGESASHKPDGWYLPVDKGAVALVLETKATDSVPIDAPSLRAQVEKYCATVRGQYDLVVGIVYDGAQTRAYVNGKPLLVPDALQPKEYYFSKLTDRPIDKARIYELTQRINNSLHSDFGIKNLYHRMIFTACALVARRYDAILVRGMDYAAFHSGILSALNKAIRSDVQQNSKLSLLSEVYSDIKMNVSTDEDDPRAIARLSNLIGDFIDWVTEISGLINSSAWNGEDVMAIFFNEFNRYKKKSESGQVFTPDHITGFMYRLLGVNKDDRVLDACAGSGSFLVKSMSNMIREAGGINTTHAKQIKAQHLYGIEFDREIYALACANMLIHKDGKTNLAHMDARTESAGSWIEQTGATKVLMNPPYETKFGCMVIVENVLDHVDRGTLCGFILPDKKLEKTSVRQMSRILRHHRLLKVVKLPENLFFGVGVTTSIFIFEAGKPQNDKKFFAVNIQDDGLVTVKNQGRHDTRGKWPALEDYWVDAIERHDDSEFNTGHWADPADHLSWQAPEKPFTLTREDFAQAAMEYALFRRGINGRALREQLGQTALFSAEVKTLGNTITLEVEQ